MLKNIAYAILIALIVTAYNSCAPQHALKHGSLSSASSICVGDLKAVFESTYHPFLKAECAACHTQGGTGNGGFADADLDIAFGEFELRNLSVIDDRALNPNHQPPFTGSQHQPTIDDISPQYQQAKASFESCKSQIEDSNNQNNNNNTNTGGMDPKDPGQAEIFTTAKTMNANDTFKTLSWDLGSELDSVSFAGASLSIEVKTFASASGLTSYHFRNPTLSTGSQALHLVRIEFTINGQANINATTYTAVSEKVPANDSKVLSTSLQIIEMPTISSDTVSLGIGALEETQINNTSPTVTFADLNAPDGVFGLHCLSCHSGANPFGNLDMTNYDELISKLMVVPNSSAMSILHMRMTDAQRPMPPAGLLPAADIEIVQQWIDNGAPR